MTEQEKREAFTLRMVRCEETAYRLNEIARLYHRIVCHASHDRGQAVLDLAASMSDQIADKLLPLDSTLKILESALHKHTSNPRWSSYTMTRETIGGTVD